MEISSLDDIQKLEAKDLREILKFSSKSTGGIRADLVSKVYALLICCDLRNLTEMNFIQLYDYPVVFYENIVTSCGEERITGSTTGAVQYGLESEAKAVAL